MSTNAAERAEDYPTLAEHFIARARELDEIATQFRESGISTKEEWEALDLMDKATRYLWSAAAKLRIHTMNYGKKEEVRNGE